MEKYGFVLIPDSPCLESPPWVKQTLLVASQVLNSELLKTWASNLIA